LARTGHVELTRVTCKTRRAELARTGHVELTRVTCKTRRVEARVAHASVCVMSLCSFVEEALAGQDEVNMTCIVEPKIALYMTLMAMMSLLC
ncbi:hypothetical protein L195_g049152, partial [Trifolium pratense]